MTNRSETFGRLLKGAINSIAAYEGKTAPAIEEDLGAQIGLAGSALQRYRAGYLPPSHAASRSSPMRPSGAATSAEPGCTHFSRLRAISHQRR
jgi:hypothetical protein